MNTEVIYPPFKPTAPVAVGISRHEKYMNILSKVAITVEPVAQARIAACIVYKNEIISFGINKKKSHPFQAKFGKNKDSIYLHAENDCIKNALRNLSVDEVAKSTLYICRVKFDMTKNFVFGLAKPCPGCARAIASFGIKNVIYSNDNMGYEYL